MDNFESVLHNSHCHQFLSVVAAVHHKTVSKTFHNGALSFPKSFRRITTSRVWQIFRILLLYCNVILQIDQFSLLWLQIYYYSLPLVTHPVYYNTLH